MPTPADDDFDAPRDPMTRAGLALLATATLASWLAVWALYRALHGLLLIAL